MGLKCCRKWLAIGCVPTIFFSTASMAGDKRVEGNENFYGKRLVETG